MDKNRPQQQIEDELDKALAGSFPASDPVAIGHSEHAGQPRDLPLSRPPRAPKKQ
jgi:hypothetical protein